MNMLRTELKKTNLKVYFKASFGILAGILAMGILFLFLPEIEGSAPKGEELFHEWDGIFMLISVLNSVSFGILAAVAAARLVIGEYGGKGAAVILCYPIKQKKILNAKCLIICVFITAAEFICSAVIMAALYIVSEIAGAELAAPSSAFPITIPCVGILAGLLSSVTGIISVTIGWKNRSVPAAVVSSFIAGCLLAQCFSFSPKNILPTTAVICAVLSTAAVFVYNSLAKSIEKLEV